MLHCHKTQLQGTGWKWASKEACMQGIGFDDSDRSALNFGDWSPAYELDTVQAAHTDLTVLRSLDFLGGTTLLSLALWLCICFRMVVLLAIASLLCTVAPGTQRRTEQRLNQPISTERSQQVTLGQQADDTEPADLTEPVDLTEPASR